VKALTVGTQLGASECSKKGVSMSGKERVIIKKNRDDLAREGAELFGLTARKSIDDQGRFAAALSGGSTPRPMYRLLGQEPYLSEIPWHSAHLFWVDERMVPFDHPDSNFGAAKEDFLDKVPIPPGQLHPMPAWATPEEGAAIYQTEIKSFFDRFGEGDDPVFDLIYLGVGKDGHTASLFPGQASLEEFERWVLSVKGGDPDVDRLTLTFPILNRSKHAVFMVSGDEKASVLKSLFQKIGDLLPARRVDPIKGLRTWLLDQAAASLLPEEIRGGEI
jgi:6-phosphogluconolactonase